MSRSWLWRCLVVGLLLWTALPSAQAQGLLWSLPEDGTWVKYTGETTTKQERPGTNEAALTITRRQELLIQSVGRETVDVDGTPTLCRWIEIKLITGTTAQGGGQAGIDPGPNGTRIYKVLLLEDRVRGQLQDDRNLPVNFLPIVQGARKIGDRPVELIQEKVLQTYPLLSPFANYQELTAAGAAESVDLPGYGAVNAELRTGSLTLENATTRSENTGEIWLSEDVPFGWAKLHVKTVRQWKRANAPADEFAPASETEVEWAAVEQGTGAKSELGELPEEAATEAASN